MRLLFRSLLGAAVLVACSPSDPASDGAPPVGGAPGAGGSPATGGLTGVGGVGGSQVPSGGSGAGPSVGGSAVGGSVNAGGTGAGGTATGGQPTGGAAAGGSGTGGSPSNDTWQAPTVPAAITAVDSEYSAWKGKFFQDCGDGTGCIHDGSQCFSEGVGYGMLAAVSAGDQAAFDHLWAFYQKWENDHGLMNWKIEACGTQIWGADAATDADLDAAFALLQAQKSWGGTYGAEAQTLIAAIFEWETMLCDGKRVLKPGDVWGACSGTGDQKINPSYFTPGYYPVFAQVDTANAAEWLALQENTYDLMDSYQARLGGLIPDWSHVDGADWYGAGFGYESVRAPWRLAVDYGLTAGERPQAILAGLFTYVQSKGGPAQVPFDANSAFRGSLTLPALTSPADLPTYYQQWISSTMDDTPYYQATLRVLFHQVLAGKFVVP